MASLMSSALIGSGNHTTVSVGQSGRLPRAPSGELCEGALSGVPIGAGISVAWSIVCLSPGIPVGNAGPVRGPPLRAQVC
jgi:hypothetical protein